jgi:proteasome lid subunit RPN8/RPN11
MELLVTRALLHQLRDRAAAAHPREACGILLGRDDRIEEARGCANVHPDPASHFEIDPQALIDAHRAARAGGPAVIGYYHSHPQGTAEPSAVDRASAACDGRVWAIIAGQEVCFWRDGERGFLPLSYNVTDG